MPEPIPVTLREGFTWSIEEMPAEAVSLLILHLLNHDFTVNDQEVFPILGIDMGTRRKTTTSLLTKWHSETVPHHQQSTGHGVVEFPAVDAP